MLSHAISFALVAVTVAGLLSAWRLVRGPSTPDRILALDTLYIEAALLIALMGFVGTVALCKYLLRGDIIE
jgi:multicomponent K+:H+ antiporter subunit F